MAAIPLINYGPHLTNVIAISSTVCHAAKCTLLQDVRKTLITIYFPIVHCAPRADLPEIRTKATYL